MSKLPGQLMSMAIIGAVEGMIHAPTDDAVTYHNKRNADYNRDEEAAARIREENAARRKANFIKQKKAKSQMKRVDTEVSP